jgi:hypothetical protein
MAAQRRAILLMLLAVVLGVFLLDAHGNPAQLKADLLEAWDNFRELPIFNRP